MRYDILERIRPQNEQGLDNLGQLFNAYLGRLSTLESSALPRETMREFNRLWSEGTPTPKLNKRERGQQQNLRRLIPQFYHLQILSNSLGDLHRSVNGAIGTLRSFFAESGGDLRRYAFDNRLRVIGEYGSDEESDWYRENEADETEEWKIVFKDDEPALAPYSLPEELKQYFAEADWRGEHIGSSGVADFAYYTRLVARSLEFSPFKVLAKFSGSELPIYRQNEAGEMVEQTPAERVENEVNDELRDVRVGCYFDQVLGRLTRANACYAAARASEDFLTLLGQLESIRDCQGLLEPAHPFND